MMKHGDLALETVVRLLIVLVVLSLSLTLIYKWYTSISTQQITPDNGGTDDCTRVSVLRLASANNVGVASLVEKCRACWRENLPAKTESDCYVITMENGTFAAEGLTADGMKGALVAMNASELEVGSLAKETLLITYDASKGKVVIK